MPPRGSRPLRGAALGGRIHTVRDISVAQIDASLDLLDSVREDYPSFDDWLAKVRDEGRRAKIIGRADHPEALAIYKVEGRQLKVCTLKVRPECAGAGRATALLNELTAQARELGCTGLFIDVYERHRDLRAVLSRWGFRRQKVAGKSDERWQLALKDR